MVSGSRCRGWRCHPGSVAPRTARKTDSRLAARLAALASLGASVIHFAVVPTHWQEWMPAGLFFASVALFQLIWARAVLVRTTTLVLAAGIMLNFGAIALWALSRTSGAPFGPHAGEAELIQAADLCALLLQIYVVMGASWVWHRGLQGEPVPVFGSALVLMGAVGVVALASTVGVASGLRHGDHHGPASADGGHHGTAPGDAQGDHHGTSTGDAPADHHGTSAEPAVGGQHGTGAEHAHTPESNSESAVPPPVSEPADEPPAPAPEGAPASPAVPLHDDHGDHDHGE
ncbi:hypothetical protein H7J88_17430 [Mycolicibacterium flavescens]|uniref:Uncharacterized protein n=1 Tax=Mycolicibacterium flavescens TaxID=1776 RepID=A0A1E3RMI7_MYCFV|nr:hypothetical protein [Mycolicibacterium flavescens]MCV7281421.1 hypothetical protein [Mycolicibacterium flavescens]ODQ91081.1 hypothetical protein BHQ18_06665 [Mycolicibacterium flavescens]